MKIEFKFESVLVYGSSHISAIEHVYIKYMREAALSVDLFPAQNLFLDYYNKSNLKKILFRLGLSYIYKRIDALFRSKVLEFKPDVVWVFKGMEMYPETIIWLKEQQIKVINYNPDNPFVFSGRGSGNINVQKGVGLFDLYMTYDSNVLSKLKDSDINAALVPFGFDVPESVLNKSMKVEEVLKACFVGSADNERATFLNELASNGVSLDIYGNGWKRFVMKPSIKIFPAVYADDFWITLRKYRVQLNIMRIHNLNSHNMRSFDIPGIGGLQVAPFTPDHSQYFENEKEIFLYRDAKECASLVQKLLQMPVSEANNLRIHIRSMVVLKQYSYQDRTQEVLQNVNELFNE